MKDLENKETGNGFDEAFLDQLEKDHKKDISEFEDASKNAQDAQVKALAEKALPTLREHLDMIQKLQKQTK
jgi:putative membrane protein